MCVCVCVCVCVLSHIWLFWNSMDYIAYQAPLSMEFSRQEYWNGLPFPTTGCLPDLGIKSMSVVFPALAGRFFTTALPINNLLNIYYWNICYACFIFKKVFYCSLVDLLQCCVSFRSIEGVNQLYICIYPLFFRFFSHVGYYRVLGRVPCAIYTGKVLISYRLLVIYY